MKHWLSGLLAMIGGLLGVGLIWLVNAPPRGTPVRLLPPPTPALTVVHLAGAVKNPGVYEFPKGSRIRDAVEAAGGLHPGGDASTLNLASRLSDGMRIHVGVINPDQDAENPPGSTSSITIPTNQTSSTNLVNLNTATAAELETLSGIGPSTAEKIIAFREENGAFGAIEDIQNVSGIGPATFDKIKGEITVTE